MHITMRTLRFHLWTLVPMAALVASAGCSGGGDKITPLYNHATGRVLVQMPSELGDGDVLYARARRGTLGAGQLDCASLYGTLEGLVDRDDDMRYYGPPVDQALTVPFYGPEWAGEPTAEMLAALELGTDSIIDVCLYDSDGKVVEQIEEDLFKAWDVATDQGLNGKADDTDTNGEMRINSAQEYGVRCVGELGEIPFFEKTGEGAYTTYNCLDSTVIPMTVTDNAGNVTRPEGEVSKCDKPQYIYSLCEQGPRVASRVNSDGTRWVLLCRKSIGGLSSDQYNDIAMVGHNPFTGRACFFQNALYQKKDGGNVPHPADREKSANLWSGVHGGLGSGIQCAKCHDADAFIHTPWIDGAKNPNGTTVVPKMGEDPDYPIGANDMPYGLVNARGQGWRAIESLTDTRAGACTQCHRMGEGGEWKSWISRIDQTDSAWENIVTDEYKKFENSHWMPLDLTGLDASNWATSTYGQALAFIKTCAIGSTDCVSEPVPTSAGGVEGNGKLRNPVTLSDATLAQRAYTKLEASGCTSCHTNVRSPNGMRTWEAQTNDAEGDCLDNMDGGVEKTDTESDKTIAQDDFQLFGPYEVSIGGSFKAQITGTGDADLYVKKHAEVTSGSYDCRPFSSTSRETCGSDQFKNHGPGKFYVGIRGKAATSKITLEIEYTAKGSNQKTPEQVLTCLKKEPDNSSSPYMPQKLGMYTVGAHLGFFADLFRAAYPAGEDGNTRDTWVVELVKFKSHMSMPKGNHPRLGQKDYDEVLEWFARGLPLLSTYVQQEPTPTTCTPSITSGLTTHVAAMATQGWRAVNKARNLNMYGCGGSSDPRSCMQDLARASSKSYGSQWDAGGGILRIAREFEGSTSYWMRTSADGRFIGNGGLTDAGAAITDMQRGVDIPAHASYDPGFFPDNSGFIIQGSGANFCTTNLLTSNPAEITFEEAQCSNASNVGLYQHLASTLNNGDHFVINGQFVSDPGGGDLAAGFASDAKIQITPLAFDGEKYTQKTTVEVDSPYEGDSVLSPSGKLVISRLAGPNDSQLGYVLRRLDATPSGQSYSISTPEVARYCIQGSKPAISFDEKYMVLHRYASDRSDIYLVDLTTGQETKVSNMKAGQYALFPHFRSDNWFLFLVKDENSGKEYAVAGDAALALE
jgi:hypothetical protein